MTLIKELKVRRKVKNFYLSDILTIAGITLFGWLIRGSVAAALQIPFIIYNLIVSIILVVPSRFNPGKKIWQCFFYALKKDKCIYKPIHMNIRSDDFEK